MRFFQHIPPQLHSLLSYLLQIFTLALIYYAASLLGELLEGGQRGVMPIPLMAGIALAALIFWGIRLWPGIVLGLLLAKLPDQIPLTYIFFDATGATLQAIIAAISLRHAQFQTSLSRVSDVVLLSLVAVGISPFIGASFMGLGLLLLDQIPLEYVVQIWLTTWFSDGIGMLVLTSALLVWRRPPPQLYRDWQWLEGGLILTCLMIISSLTLKVGLGQRLTLLYLILPFAVWIAIRFEQHGATLGSLLVAIILLSGGLNRVLPGGELSGTGDLLLEIGFVGITSLTALLVAAAYSERRQAEEELFREKELALTTLHSIADGIITTNRQGLVTYLNPIAEELTGWSMTEALVKPVAEIFKIKHPLPATEAMADLVTYCLHGNVLTPRQSWLVNREQRDIVIENSAAPIRNQAGKVEGMIIVFHDVSKEYQLRQQLSHQATHDALTGLCNRREFEYQLNLLLNTAKTEAATHSLLYLDLDQFKIINDTCGHAAGDALLKQLVTVIKARVRGGDTFARLGGDEFGILLKNCPPDRISMVAEAFLNTVKQFRFVWEGKTFEVGVSIGAVPIHAKTESLATLLSQADMACYAAKEGGRNRIHIHLGADEQWVTVRQTEMHWVGHILKAIEEDRLVLYKQLIAPIKPQVHPEQHYEILLRMRDEQGAIVPPGRFLPAAERYDLMPRIDRWVIHHVFTYLANSSKQLSPTDFLAINLSGMTLNDPHFAKFIRAELLQCSIPAHSVCFEITETVAIASLDKAVEFIQEMTQLGFRFALDDFGSGVSSFGYLKQLPINYLKIDGSFIKELVTNPIDQAIVSSVTQIAHVMNLKTIAEWVENETTLEMLNVIGVDFAQGFGIAKPEPLE